MKEWNGNKRSLFARLGASNHTDHDRAENDYYATDPIAAELLLQVESELNNIWECACGAGHLAQVFLKYNKLGAYSDIVNRGFLNTILFDFLNCNCVWAGDIVTNPPYKYAKEFVEKAINTVETGHKVCMFLKIQFLEGKERKKLFAKYPPQTVYVSSSRIKCAMNGDFDNIGSSAACYAWFVWQKGYNGETTIKWIN